MIVILGANSLDDLKSAILQQIDTLGELIVATAAENQATINQLVEGLEKVKSEVVALREAYDAGQTLDFSRLQSVLGELDAVNPDAPAAEPAPAEESPADGAGVTDEEAEEGSL